MIRVGLGYDIHRFAPDRPLVLGGIVISSRQGLLGHSDADVLVHAICDALLGASALGDIGTHFPDSDDQFEGVSSLSFLTSIRSMFVERHLKLVNVDSTLVLESPKIASYIPEMRRAIAAALGVDSSQISIKATTNEGLGALGRREGCAAYAIACIEAPS